MNLPTTIPHELGLRRWCKLRCHQYFWLGCHIQIYYMEDCSGNGHPDYVSHCLMSVLPNGRSSRKPSMSMNCFVNQSGPNAIARLAVALSKLQSLCHGWWLHCQSYNECCMKWIAWMLSDVAEGDQFLIRNFNSSSRWTVIIASS